MLRLGHKCNPASILSSATGACLVPSQQRDFMRSLFVNVSADVSHDQLRLSPQSLDHSCEHAHAQAQGISKSDTLLRLWL